MPSCSMRRPADTSHSSFAGGGGRGTSTTSPPGGAECAGTRSKVAVHYRAGWPPASTTTAAVSGSAGCGDRRHCRDSSPVAGCSASAPGPQSLRVEVFVRVPSLQSGQQVAQGRVPGQRGLG